MKRTSKILTFILAFVIVLIAVYRLVNTAPSAELPENIQVAEIMDRGGCLTCHDAQPELPFYAEWPVVGKMVKKEAFLAQKQIDLNQAYASLREGLPVDIVAMAKLEKTALDGTMPPINYHLVHWGSALTHRKREAVMIWAANHRLDNYYNGLACPEFANEPIQPIGKVSGIDSTKAELGRILFHDTRLSADNTISCASCHELTTAGVDNEPVSDGVGGKEGGINAPTVFNSVFNFVQFWDGRAATLALQAAGPPLNPVEMACSSFDEIIAKLKKDKKLTSDFLKVYPEGYSEAAITDAIGEFEKTLTTPDSRFDRYLKGDIAALAESEKEGYLLFKGYECATCHTGVNMGGESYEFMGLQNDYFAARGTELTEEDNGRFKQTGIERDRHRFKVPGLRNVALTWPYFHDASQPTLREAINAMGIYQLDIQFTDAELTKMEQFMGTLTGEYNGALLTNTNIQE